tara:strand:+ start:141 stop:521 length:381 start_codon:yes stop_codon:yes gene_type:complete
MKGDFLSFKVKTKKGKVDQKKTDRLKRRMDKACKKINDTVFSEIGDFRKMAEEMGVGESFWLAACHRAMLTLHGQGMDVFLSAEFGDLFGSADFMEPTMQNSWLDIERVQAAKEKHEAKMAKRAAK